MSLYKLGEGVPKIGENNFLADSCTIIGDVETGSNVSIWYSAILRADASKIKIGDNSNIQDNSTVHGDITSPVDIGKNVTVGHNCVVHGCTVGDNVVIGMGSIILNDSKIPSNCIVAAGSLVTKKLKIEEGCLVAGNPAQVIKKLSEDNIKYIQYAKDFYIKDIELYKKLEKL
ncbi:MAG: gamma carbonic anhydrase family protein [Fusobacteriaceae bacterium]